MECEVPQLKGIVIVMSRATRAMQQALNYNGADRYQGQNVATLSSTGFILEIGQCNFRGTLSRLCSKEKMPQAPKHFS